MIASGCRLDQFAIVTEDADHHAPGLRAPEHSTARARLSASDFVNGSL
jgi:hypothetical protein